MASARAWLAACALAAAAQAQLIPLPPGSFYSGSLPRFGSVFFSMNLTQFAVGGVLDLSLSRLTANTDMYVTLGSAGGGSGARPSASNYAYASTAATGRNTILVVAGQGPAASGPCSGAGSACSVTIGLYAGLFASSYALFTSSNRTSSALQSGVPRSDWLPLSGSYNFYSLSSIFPASAQPRFTFSLSATSGDPDMFVSTRNAFPSAATPYCWLASGSGDTVEVGPADDTGCYCAGPNCVYYVGILAASGSGTYYTLVATEDTGGTSVITLQDGVPLSGALARSEAQLYQFTLPESQAPGRRVEAIVTPLLGDPDLYITFAPVQPDRTGQANAYQSLAAQGPEDIVMSDSDAVWQRGACANWSLPCTFNMMVLAYTACSYSIQVYTGAAPLTLSPGVPVEGTVSSGSYNYYTFTPPGAASETVILSLTANFGDPDLYVGTTANAATARPTSTPGTYTWSALNYGSDVLSIDAQDSAACARAPPPAASGGAACAYTIAVASYGGNASYTLLARTRNGTPVRLAPGLPLQDVLEASGLARYTAVFDFTRAGGSPPLPAAPAKLELVVSPQAGDPDLYVSIGSGRLPVLNNMSSVDYMSLAASGDEDIVIRETDAAVLRNCPAPRRTPCIVNVAVHAFGAATAAYAVTAFALPPNPTPTLRVLEDAAGTSGTTFAGDYAYFVYELAPGTPPSPISIVVTPLGFNSDPDVYVVANPSPFALPSTASYQWLSNQPAGSVDRVTIDPSDARLTSRCPLVAVTCRLYIAVYGWPLGAPTARFSIIASSAGVQSLAVGTPSASAVARGSLAYFSFYLPPGARPLGGLEFTVTPLNGAADAVLYVGNVVDPSSRRTKWPRKQCSFPSDPTCAAYTIVNSVWSSTASLTRREVLIPASDSRLTSGTTYIAAVYSASGGDLVSVTANYGSSWRTLVSGVPAQGAITRGAYAYYRLILTQPNSAVNITVTPIVGDPDLFVSFNSSNPRPGLYPATYDMASMRISGPDAVYAAWLNMPECVAATMPPQSCGVYISVYGYTNASYTIVATASDGGPVAIELLDGLPQAGTVAQGGSAFFFADVDLDPSEAYSFYVRSLSGDPDLYVATDGSVPSTTRYAYRSASGTGDDYVNVQPSDGAPLYNASTRAYAMVYGFTAATFEVTFASGYAVETLGDGQTVRGAVSGGGYAYYSFAVGDPSQAQPVTLASTATVGDPDLYVAVWDPAAPDFRPTDAAYTWRGDSLGSDTVVIQPAALDARACQGRSPAAPSCAYIVGVKCADGNACRFTLTASSGVQLISLVDGQALDNVVPAPGALTYFTFSAFGRSGSDRDVTISLSGGAADTLQLYVTNGYSTATTPPGGVLPSPSAYVWSDAATPGTVNITASDPRAAAPPGLGSLLFTIGVFWPPSGPVTPGVTRAFTITAVTSQALTALSPGRPSPQRTLPSGATHFYYYTLPSGAAPLASDLVLTATVLTGAPVLAGTTDAAALPQLCAPASATCDLGVWTSVPASAAGGETSLRVYAPPLGPCSTTSPYRNSSVPCNASAVWVGGQTFFFAVHAPPPASGSGPRLSTTYSLTAMSGTPLTELADGAPAAGSIVPTSAPPVYYFITSPDASNPDVRFSFTIGASSGSGSAGPPLLYYITSCLEGACTPSDYAPGPANAKLSGVAPRGATQDIFITRYNARAYCAPLAVPTTRHCSYFIAFRPASPSDCTGDPQSCTFTLVAQSMGGGGFTSVPFSSIDRTANTHLGNVQPWPAAAAPGRPAVFELYLEASNPAADIRVDLQACGPGFPTLALCNPSPGAGGPAPCAAPANPLPGGAGANTAAADTFPSGRALLVDRGVQGVGAYFVGVSGGGGGAPALPPALAGSAWGYQLILSSGATVFLASGGGGALTAAQPGAPGALNVSWGSAVLVDQEGGALPARARGVAYTVYYSKGGFAAGGAGLASTACGLSNWGEAPGAPTAVAASALDAGWVELVGLESGATYGVNVVAVCDAACWRATAAEAEEGLARGLAGGALSQAQWEAETQRWQRLRDAPPQEVQVPAPASAALPAAPAARGLQPGYRNQRVAYTVLVTSASGGATGAPTSTSKTLSPAALAALGFLGVVLLGAGYFAARYYRARAADRVHQYETIETGGAMTTISVPAVASMNWSGESGEEAAPPGGMLGSLRSLFGGAGGSKGYKGVGLASTADHSELDDRAQAFL